MGPSPLTRGNPSQHIGRLARSGSIPAHTGQPSGRVAHCSAGRVHPRSHGATDCGQGGIGKHQGPSPLTRGNLNGCRQGAAGRGSIPAHTGQPARAADSRRQAGVHPRSHGATGAATWAFSVSWGPSPLTRGNPIGRAGGQAGDGSIPAHTGQPLQRNPRPRKRKLPNTSRILRSASRRRCTAPD